MKVISDTKKPVKIWTDEIEPEAEAQLRNVSSLPFIFRHVAAMPDVHAGWGSTIGSVIATQGAVCPSAVGVDIGCGMLAVDLDKRLDDMDLKKTFDTIENSIPLGFKGHERPSALPGIYSERVKSVIDKAPYQLGTLGGGNHFIEICDDGDGNAWLMLHSGSRGVGKKVADIHIKKAKKIMDMWHIPLADPELAYLVEGCPEFSDYIQDVTWCQLYAHVNRATMARIIFSNLGLNPKMETMVNCHHNYVEKENHFGKNVLVTRKGAVRAREGELGIIPGSMGTKSYIVRGKGNPDSFCSCSHGAGRRMSRTKAKALYTTQDLESQTQGVVCRKDAGIIDEIPGAYKDLDVVMENQKDLVEVVKTLKAVVCVKG